VTSEPGEGESGRASDAAPSPVTAERIEALERAVADLARDVAAMRSEGARRAATVATVRAFAPPPPPPAPPPPLSSAVFTTPRWTMASVESIVGRYGVLALATVCVLAMVGTFLGWAMRHGYLELGPTARISLGLLLALAVGAYGIRLRRSERSFGDTLLGLALAITHVCAWAAGPLLGIVPESAALALATVASTALAMLAHKELDEPLWCVGFGGAAIAPFVTSREAGSALLLFAYAAAILLAGGLALRGRHWRIAGRVQSLVLLLYTSTLASMTDRSGGPLLALGLVAGVAMALVRVDERDLRRSWLRGCGILGVLVALRVASARDLPIDALPFVIGAFVAWLLILLHTASDPAGEIVHGLIPRVTPAADWLDGAWMPLGLLAAVLVALPDVHGPYLHATMSGVGAISMLILVARVEHAVLRDALALAFSVASLEVAWYLSRELQTPGTLAVIATVSLVLFTANRRWPSVSWLAVGLISLGLATVVSYGELEARPAFEYPPLLTVPSAVALWITIVWILGASLARGAFLARSRAGATDGRVTVHSAMFLAAGVFAYVWLLQELSRAVNPTVATLLVVTYFAATSVAAVGVGRARDIAALRHAGLVLALLAAGKALQGARSIGVGARILAYLVAAVFLLSIAYWYRRRGTDLGRESG
jgi:hypothetical protein